MLSARVEEVLIRAKIEELEKARKECNDTGIQKQIDVWIEEQKQKLATVKNPKWPAVAAPQG